MTNVIVLHVHTPGTPHHCGTPLENSGTPWGVRYTRLISTAVVYTRNVIFFTAISLITSELSAVASTSNLWMHYFDTLL